MQNVTNILTNLNLCKQVVSEKHLFYFIENHDDEEYRFDTEGIKSLEDPESKSWDAIDTLTPEDTFQRLEKRLSSYLGEHHKLESTIMILIILLTYCHQLFQTLPLLWIYCPSQSVRNLINLVISYIVFCPLQHQSYYSIKFYLDFFEKYTPSIIITSNDSKNSVPEWLLNSLNDKRNAIMNSNLTKINIYSPRIIISDSPVRRMLKPNTFQLNFQYVEDIDYQYLDKIHKFFPSIARLILTLSPVIEKNIEIYKTKINQYKPVFPLKIILISLKKGDLINEDEFNQIDTELDRLSNLTSQDFSYNAEYEILYLVEKFLDSEFTDFFLDGLIPLDSICDFVEKYSEMVTKLTPKSLSQLLNKYNLIEDRKRVYNKRVGSGITHIDSTKQLTVIKINRTHLKRHL